MQAVGKKEQDEKIFYNYVADSLFYSSQDMRLTQRYAELLERKPVDRRSGDEIARDVINKIGLKVETDECI